MELAQSKGLDLIEVSPLAHPPVCRIADYGKLLYKMAKQDRQQKAKQKKIEVKGIRIRPSTGRHDLDFKLKQAVKFLKDDNKVKIEMMLRDREKKFGDLALQKLNGFLKEIMGAMKEEKIIVEQIPKRGPMGFTTVIGRSKKLSNTPSVPNTPRIQNNNTN